MSSSRARSQGGYTLVELLLSVGIALLLIVPLSAWVVLAMRQQPVVQDQSLGVASEALLGIALRKDLTVAAAAAVDDTNDEVPFTDCLDGPGSEGAAVLLVLHLVDVEPVKVVYKEAPLRDGRGPHGSRRSIWRRECPLGNPYQTTAEEVLLDVRPGQSRAQCPVTAAAAICRHIEVRAVPAGGSEFSIRGTRRVDAASLRFDRTGNRLPVAKISVTSQSGDGPFTVTLSPAESRDDDGWIESYEWTIPLGPFVENDPDRQFETRYDPEDLGVAEGRPQVVTWPEPGTYFVQLTVTDNLGATATTYKRVELARAGVVADLRVSPTRGAAESTEFEFAARWFDEELDEEVGARGGDGRTLAYEWTVQSPPPDPFDLEGNLIQPPPLPAPYTRFRVVRSDPEPFRSALPASMVGPVQVTLRVYDVGEPDVSDSVTYPLTLDPPPPTFAPPVLEEADDDDPVADGTATVIAGLDLSLDSSASRPGSSGSPIVARSWDFGPGVPPAAGPDPLMSLTLPGGGTHRYLLTVTDADGRVGRVFASVEVDAPLPPVPTVGVVAGRLTWAEVPGASSYRIEHRTPSCGGVASATFASGFRTGQMSAPVLPSACADPAGSQARVVVARRLAGETVETVASPWVPTAPVLGARVGGGG